MPDGTKEIEQKCYNFFCQLTFFQLFLATRGVRPPPTHGGGLYGYIGFPHGSYMVPDSPHMVPDGPHMVTDGPYMVPTWSLMISHGPWWSPHGSYMVPNVPYMVPGGPWWSSLLTWSLVVPDDKHMVRHRFMYLVLVQKFFTYTTL